MNVKQEPLSFDGALGQFFHSATVGILRPPSADRYNSSSYYTNMDDEEAGFQSDKCDEAKGTGSFRGKFRSMFDGGSREPAAPPPRAPGFFRKVQDNGLVQALTPGFLRSDEEDDFATTCCPHLSFKTRIFGCLCCFCLGQFLQFLSVSSLPLVLVGHPGRFARCYSLGNVMMVAGSFFLSGPKAQCRKIKAKNRALSFIVFLTTMLLTTCAVFSSSLPLRGLTVLLLVAAQWCAQVWYILSYIPYGHRIARRVLGSVGSWCCFG